MSASKDSRDSKDDSQFDLFGGMDAGLPQPASGEAGPDSPDRPAAAAEPAPTAEPKRGRRARAVLAATPSPDVLDWAQALPPHVHLGTSSWSFPGWEGIVYGEAYSDSKLARDGLAAYGAHPLLRTVSIDRSFYAPLSVADYLRYAQQVPDGFRFVVKAPASVTDATLRAERGEPIAENPCFLDARLATDEFVTPCLEGLGAKAGSLVFQFPPLPDRILADPIAFVERLGAFFDALPRLPASGPHAGEATSPSAAPCYALEIRDACLLTPRLIRMLRERGVRYCVGLHARMPDPLRQAAALALLDGDTPCGPLIVRWSLHGGFKYEQAKAKYEPFNRLVDEDPATRSALAELAARYAIAGQPVLIVANNKAEGSAPLTCAGLAREIAAACARLREEPPADGAPAAAA
ncbi:DUF72 domain-containing protein [Trinickia dinghuensis]|uniref:DUF72 domain-containing protein n=1 Tax=Trinickia dinghuensis TaxID=2291023 RepID=A0A3D8K4H9_9BURK|nr:DUF72 domain-containing protein [Trinickia dinghuensis]RDV00130.1 DUF72 domain-containing protein [Trinickia dinghuensis]